jgi:type II secretory pathway pseudopilin PulG
MLIVTILAIIVAIALPSLLQTRKSANEGAAVAAMRTLSTAELWYRLRNRVYASVPDLVAARCLDDAWGDLVRDGYVFNAIVPADGSTWAATAQPQVPGVTGDRFFYADERGVIRSRDGAPATVADPAID